MNHTPDTEREPWVDSYGWVWTWCTKCCDWHRHHYREETT